MCKLIAILSAAISVWFVSAPSFAITSSAQIAVNIDRSVVNARLVCDEFGRCWQTQSEPNVYIPRAPRPYSYGSAYPYSGYGYGSGVRPLSKWERKGFCPPGQRKKGNC